MLYLDIFEVCMEVTLKLRLVFARHCDIFSLHYNYVIYLFNIVTFLIALELGYILVCSSYVLKLLYKVIIF